MSHTCRCQTCLACVERDAAVVSLSLPPDDAEQDILPYMVRIATALRVPLHHVSECLEPLIAKANGAD